MILLVDKHQLFGEGGCPNFLSQSSSDDQTKIKAQGEDEAKI